MELLRYVAFSSDPEGGNPAGVVLDAGPATVTDMQQVAAEVGYSETAFLVGRGEEGDFDVRYFSPLAEVAFCGHATIAAAVAWAERKGVGELTFRTAAGLIAITTTSGPEGVSATLTSVTPRQAELPAGDLTRLLAALRLSPAHLESSLPPLIAYAGAHHPVIALAERGVLAGLDYNFDMLQILMGERDWTTVQLIWRESPTVFHSRNPFPPGGVVEDPATGAAAAALGGYLRALELVDTPAEVTIHQGNDLGRPSVIRISIPADPASGIRVTGTAVAIRPDNDVFRIAFVHPEIAGNTGSAIRLSAVTGCELHLVRPLGFDLSDTKLRRAGLDYHDLASVTVHEDLAAAWSVLMPARVFAFTTRATQPFADIAYRPTDVLMFGCESRGLPDDVLADGHVTAELRIPMLAARRSLNLANAAAIAVYEAWRQHGYA